MKDQEIIKYIDDMITTLLDDFPEAFKGEKIDALTSKSYQKAIETLLRYIIKLGERKGIEKARNWMVLNTTTEFLYKNEHDDYPISYVRVVGIKDTMELMDKFTKAMER